MSSIRNHRLLTVRRPGGYNRNVTDMEERLGFGAQMLSGTVANLTLLISGRDLEPGWIVDHQSRTTS